MALSVERIYPPKPLIPQTQGKTPSVAGYISAHTHNRDL